MGVYFPWNLQGPLGLAVPAETPVVSFADISAAGGPADQWDALPSAAKIQIIMAVGFLEMVSEASAFLEMDGTKHYVRGGKPGYFPTITEKMPPERKEEALLAEINNGRLAMLGIMGCISVSK